MENEYTNLIKFPCAVKVRRLTVTSSSRGTSAAVASESTMVAHKDKSAVGGEAGSCSRGPLRGWEKVLGSGWNS